MLACERNLVLEPSCAPLADSSSGGVRPLVWIRDLREQDQTIYIKGRGSLRALRKIASIHLLLLCWLCDNVGAAQRAIGVTCGHTATCSGFILVHLFCLFSTTEVPASLASAMPAMGACNATCMHATRMHAQDGQHDICASYLHPALSYLGQP